MRITTVTDSMVTIDFFEQWTTCSRCGKDTPGRWGLPVDIDTGNIVPTWFEAQPGSWGGMPACEDCYEWHQRWSERIAAPFDAPLC